LQIGSTQVLVLAGNDSGDSGNCLSGGYSIDFSATICTTSIDGHDNTIDNIAL
jgi:hypothetical protein